MGDSLSYLDNLLQEHDTPGGRGGTPRKIGLGCVAHFSNPLPYL